MGGQPVSGNFSVAEAMPSQDEMDLWPRFQMVVFLFLILLEGPVPWEAIFPPQPE